MGFYEALELIITLFSAAYDLRMVRFQSIEESLGKIKDSGFLPDKRLFLNVCILFGAATSSFLTGKLTSLRDNDYPVILESCHMVFQATSTTAGASSFGISSQEGAYVGSRSSRRFHRDDCPSARLIKEGNRVSFSSKEDALAAGYAPAGNCDM